MSNKWLIILKKEFLETVRTKAFVIGTILTPLILGMVIGLPTFLMKKNAEKVRDYYIKDDSGFIAASLQEQLPQVIRLKTWEGTKEEGTAAIKSKEIETFIYIPADVYESYSFDFQAQTISDKQSIAIVENAISAIIRSKKLIEKNIKKEDVAVILKRATAQTFSVSKEGKKAKDADAAFFIAYILVFMMYMSVLSYAPRMVQSTVEDKNNRVVEVVVSHVKATDIMAGKIVGNAFVGIFQYLIWGSLAAVIINFVGKSYVSGVFSQVNPIIFAYFVLYFVLGYLIYAIAFAAIGAMFSDMRDAGNMMTPFIMLAVLPMILFAPIAQAPQSTLALWASEFPFFSSLMLMRIGISEVPTWQIVLSIMLQLVTIAVELWLAAKIYRIGILSYGKKPTMKELVAWIKAK